MELDKRWIALAVFILLLVFAGGVKYADFKNDRQAEEEILLDASVSETQEDPKYGADDKVIQVYITGAVKHPGVYRLQEGDRMYQAVEMAGGTGEDADIRYIDMARPLVDGETISVPFQGENAELPVSTTGTYSNTASSSRNQGLVNINIASAQEMADRLDGIGPALGQRIVDYRTNNGPFKDIEEIKNVSGIGDKRFEAIKDKITVR
jgi:competence protein ComEA